jgi:hypothetical protein
VGPARVETVKGPSEPVTVYPLLAVREPAVGADEGRPPGLDGAPAGGG